MKNLLLLTLPFVFAVIVSAGEPARLKRADSFFGIHFDFHAGADCTEVGKGIADCRFGTYL